MLNLFYLINTVPPHVPHMPRSEAQSSLHVKKSTLKGKPQKKVISLMAVPFINALAIKKKLTFLDVVFYNLLKKFRLSLSSKGWALMALSSSYFSSSFIHFRRAAECILTFNVV